MLSKCFIKEPKPVEPATFESEMPIRLWNFKAEQRVFQIGGISIGGVPGQRPVVLVGTLFYHGHKVVKDENAGAFDEAAAEALVKAQDEMSDKTGNPAMIDVVGGSVPAMKKYLEFVVDRTKAPIMIDSPSAEIRAVGRGVRRGV